MTKRILTYGTFDMFHIGHLNLLKRLKEKGDYLVVAVSTDEFNKKKNKHSIIPFEQRKEIVEAIKYVDLVIPENTWEQKKEDIKKYNIDLLIMGDDWKGKFDYLKEYCNVEYIPRTKDISTTKIKKVLSSFDKETILNLKKLFDIVESLKKDFE